jgi:PleD family two-component response regulator
MALSSGKNRVLIANDEEAMCKRISHLLEQEGFEPLVALDGKTAFAPPRRTQ